MKNNKDADVKISSVQMMVAVPSMIIGVAILLLPNYLAIKTVAADGWITIITTGIMAMIIARCVAKLASNYPGKSFMEYASMIVTKPVAILFTLIFSLISLNLASYQIRSIANISKKYLLDETPLEVTSLIFLLVVIYAVAGDRNGIFHLNMLFFPIILFITLLVVAFSIGNIQFGHLQPMFQTDFKGYFQGIKAGLLSYLGFGLFWFYTQYMEEPKKTPKVAVIGVGISIIVYILIFIVTLGVFGNAVTSNLLYPTIELAKSVNIPGEFFERFESVFFVIWIMAIFNTTAIIVDILVLTLSSIFTKVSKLSILYITSPLIFFIAMVPRDIASIDTYGYAISSFTVSFTVFVLVILYSVSKIRGQNK